MNMDINRLGELKRRIIDAMEVIGRPANIKEIAEEVGENRPIHSRISELVEAGWIVKIPNPTGLTHYSLRESEPVQDGGSPSPARSSKPEPDSQVSPSAQGSSSETVAQVSPVSLASKPEPDSQVATGSPPPTAEDPIISLLIDHYSDWETPPTTHAERLRVLAAGRMHPKVQLWLLELAGELDRLGAGTQ